MNQRDKSIQFIEEVCKLTWLKYSALATKAGVAPSTINRFVRDSNISELSIGTRDKLAKVVGYDSYESYVRKQKPTVVDEYLLKDCADIIMQEAEKLGKRPGMYKTIKLAIELYKIAEEDRKQGNNVVSIGAAKRLILEEGNLND